MSVLSRASLAWRRWLPVAHGSIAAHVAGSAALGWGGAAPRLGAAGDADRDGA